MTMHRLALIIACAASITVAAQGSPLKIVVVEGEAGVNIIQQKTAVKPIVEVRDRNNQPVAGVIVTFSIEGGKAATFGGSSTLTIATNAAGRTAVSSLTPNIAGTFQIQVSAAFQGQVATATIAQTNVITAAQAAAAGAASGGSSSAASTGGAGSGAGGSAGGVSGAAGGAGGGLSATTIAVAGAAVAGGAVAAAEVVKKGNGGAEQQVFSGSFTATEVEAVTSRVSGQVCTITRNVTGTARLAVDTNNPGNVDGDLGLTGTSTPIAFNCGNNQPSVQFGTSVKVSGPTSALRGSSTQTGTNAGQQPGESITDTQTSTFEGAISGSAMTGTLKVEHKGQSTGGSGGPVDFNRITGVSLNLAKS